MNKEEFIENTASQLWDEMQSNSGIRDELNALELYSMENFMALSSWSQIYARFSLAAAFVGAELVDKALVAADCLNLEEMKEMAEADEFNEQDSV